MDDNSKKYLYQQIDTKDTVIYNAFILPTISENSFFKKVLKKPSIRSLLSGIKKKIPEISKVFPKNKNGEKKSEKRSLEEYIAMTHEYDEFADEFDIVDEFVIADEFEYKVVGVVESDGGYYSDDASTSVDVEPDEVVADETEKKLETSKRVDLPVQIKSLMATKTSKELLDLASISIGSVKADELVADETKKKLETVEDLPDKIINGHSIKSLIATYSMEELLNLAIARSDKNDGELFK